MVDLMMLTSTVVDGNPGDVDLHGGGMVALVMLTSTVVECCLLYTSDAADE